MITGVALDKNAVRVTVQGVKDEPGIAFKVFNCLAQKNVNVDIILQSVSHGDTQDISFTVDHDNLDEAVEVLRENQKRLTFHSIQADTEIAKLSVVGAGMVSNPGVAAKLFEALYNENINVEMISTSEIRITVIVAAKDGERAMNAVHEAFYRPNE